MDAPKEQRSGCLLALYVLFGGGAAILVIGGIALFWFLRTPEGHQMLEAVRQGADWAAEAQGAPGAAELREAGCDVALVSTFEQVEGVVAQLFPDGQVPLTPEGAAGSGFVLCSLDPNVLPGPVCPQVARTYGEAVDPAPESFLLLVRDQRDGDLVCQGVYDPDGSLLREVEFGASESSDAVVDDLE